MAAIEYNAKGGPLRPGDEKLGLSPNALRVLEKRYFLKDSEGRIVETPAKLFRRVAHNLAQADRLYDPAADVKATEEKFYELMAKLEFLPNSPTLMNAGAGADLSLSACFVLPVGDSLREIFDALKWQALIHQAGGGTGFAFTRLRPAGDMVKSTQGVASGPVSFMKIFDAATDQIKQGGRRRGANMGILRVDHPDIGEFITCKEDVHAITNFNISVAVTDRFMEAVRKGEKYDLINPRTGKVVKQLDARTVFDKIAHQAWKNGEPGLFFIDITNRTNPFPNIGEFEATNPCVAGDTIVMTDRGPIAVKDLYHLAAREAVKVATDDRTVGGDARVTLREAQGVYKSGIKTIWRLTTRAGYRLRATYDHRILTPRGWVELGILRRGDNILVQPLATPTPGTVATAETVEAIPMAADGGRVTSPFEDEVVAVEKWGKEVVYDITEPMTHSFIASGIVVHNCVAGDTMVSTERGLVTIAELARRYPHGGISIVTDRRVPAQIFTESNGLLLVSQEQERAPRGTRLGLITGAWCSGVKPVWNLVTESGSELMATADHKVFTIGGKKTVEELQLGDKLLIQSGEGRFPEGRVLPFRPPNIYIGENGHTSRLNLPTEWSRELGLVLGWLVGDGWIRCGDRNCRVGFTFSNADAAMFATLKPILSNWYGRPIAGVRRDNGVYHLSYHSKYFVDFFRELGVKAVESSEKEVPASIFQAPKDVVVAYLQALFTADGTVRDHPKGHSAAVVLTSKSRKLLQGVQLLLLNLGIRSRMLNRSRPARASISLEHTTKDGQYRTYGSDGILYELFIMGQGRDRFRVEIGFLDEKQAKLTSACARFTKVKQVLFEDRVVEKTLIGEREVYDLTEPASHSMSANGLICSNCGEQPLLAFESCNLGSIVLDKHMKRAGKAWEMDWDHLERSVRGCVHLLDNIIDMNNFPIPQIEELTKATRKIGLGVMGFARVLFKLGVAYDSPEGVEWGRRIMEFINAKAMDESQRLAEKRGVYQAWKGSMHEKMGLRMRNSYVTTVAPTGTICMIADTSGGCEPEFSLIWYKNVMDGDHLPYMLDYFLEVAREEGFWSKDLVEKILANHGSCRGLKEVPEKWQRAFATSHDITPEWHVRMQAAFQESCSAAVSKCVTGDSWIFTERGMLRIGSLHRGEAPDSFSDRNLRVAGNPGITIAKEYYYGGAQPVVRVSTDLGLALGGTPVHQVKVVEDGAIVWKRMASLKPGDRLLVEYGYGLFGNVYDFAKVYGHPFRYVRRTNSKDVRIPHKITTDLARLLGYLVADGGWSLNSMYLTNEDDAVLEDFQAIAARRFGVQAGITYDPRTTATRTAHADSREIVSFLRDYLGISNRAETKQVPEIILRSGRGIQREFIRGLTLDGYVRADGRIVPLTTTSKELATQVQMMLLNLGIPSMLSPKPIHYEYKDNGNRKEQAYELVVVSDWRRGYVERIGFAEGRKQEAARGRLRTPGDTYHGIPVSVADLQTLALAKARVAHSRRFQQQLWQLPSRARAGRIPSRETLLWFLDVTSDFSDLPAWKRIAELVRGPFLCAQVEEIIHGYEEVHDFHVPSNHTFVANGFVSHNTINLPHEATVEDVKKAYLLAYELGCKGITVYRDGSRPKQVLNVGVDAKEAKAPQEQGTPEVEVKIPPVIKPRPRPDVVTGRTQRIRTGYGNLFVTINEDEFGLVEVFAQIGRGGGYTASFTEAVARLISICLRSGVPVEEIINQLEGIRSPRLAWDRQEAIFSVPDGLAKALRRHTSGQVQKQLPSVESFEETPRARTDTERDKEVRDDTEAIVKAGFNPECPECGQTLIFEESCVRCRSCGYSEC